MTIDFIRSIHFNPLHTHFFCIGDITAVHSQLRRLNIGLVIFNVRIMIGDIENKIIRWICLHTNFVMLLHLPVLMIARLSAAWPLTVGRPATFTPTGLKLVEYVANVLIYLFTLYANVSWYVTFVSSASATYAWLV